MGARVSQPGRYQILDAQGATVGQVDVPEQAVIGGRTLTLAATPPPETPAPTSKDVEPPARAD